jgi:hypothetical protein
MTMNHRHFKEHLLLYGSDLSAWPEETREEAREALLNSSDLQELVAEHRRFEEILRGRTYEEPTLGLAERIISASEFGRKAESSSIRAFFSELFAGFTLRSWAVTAAASLLLGFAIGLSNPVGSALSNQEEISLQEFLYYEGEVL